MFSFLPPSAKRRLASLLKSWHDDLLHDPVEAKRNAAAWQPSSPTDSYYRPYRQLPHPIVSPGTFPSEIAGRTTGPMTDPSVQIPFLPQAVYVSEEEQQREQEQEREKSLLLARVAAEIPVEENVRPFLRYARLLNDQGHPVGQTTQYHRIVQDTDKIHLAAVRKLVAQTNTQQKKKQ
jgi:hypothetical protein